MATDNFPEDGEEFFEALVGREQGLPGAKALREALEAEAKTLREAEGASAEDLSADERQIMTAIKQRLLDAGLLPPTSPAQVHGVTSDAPPPSSRQQSASLWTKQLSRLGEWLFGGDRLRPVAIAASVVVASLVVIIVGTPTNQPTDDVMRGDSVLVITAADPAAEVAQLEQKLKAAGAEVIHAKLNDTEWALEVNVEKPEQLEQVKQVLRGAGYLIGKQPPYELEVRQK